MSQYKTCVPSLPYPFFLQLSLGRARWLANYGPNIRKAMWRAPNKRPHPTLLPAKRCNIKCPMFKTWSKFWTNPTKKSAVAPKKEPSQVDAKKFFWEIQKCAQSTARSCSIIWQLFFIAEKIFIWGKISSFFAYHDCSFSCIMEDDCDDDHNKALTGWSCSQCKSPVGWTHDVGVSSLSKV